MNEWMLRHSAALTVFLALTLLGGRPSAGANAPTPTPAPAPAPVSVPAVLTLADAQNIALAASPQLELARASVDAGQAAVGLAASAGLPQLNAIGAVQQAKGGFGGGGTSGGASSGGTSGGGSSTSSSFTGSAVSQTSAGLNLRQLIFDGGRVRSQVVAATLNADAARLQLRREVQTVFFNVAQQYYAALQARHQLDIAYNARRLSLVQLQLVQAQYRAGVISKADVETAQLPVAQADLAVAQAQNGERTAVVTLLNTMGVSPQTPASLKDDTTIGGSVQELTSALDIAQRSRPDALAARAGLDSAKASARAARAAHFPSLSATATDGVANIAGNGYNNTYSYGASLTFPLYLGGQIRAQVAAADAQVRTANANLVTTDLAVALSVQQAVLALQTARAGLTAANAELAQARTVLNATNAQYKAGVTTLPLLLNAQTQYSKAESDGVNAIYAYKIAQQQLAFAQGTL